MTRKCAARACSWTLTYIFSIKDNDPFSLTRTSWLSRQHTHMCARVFLTLTCVFSIKDYVHRSFCLTRTCSLNRQHVHVHVLVPGHSCVCSVLEVMYIDPINLTLTSSLSRQHAHFYHGVTCVRLSVTHGFRIKVNVCVRRHSRTCSVLKIINAHRSFQFDT